jgi:hypothetical protein
MEFLQCIVAVMIGRPRSVLVLKKLRVHVEIHVTFVNAHGFLLP